MIIPICEYIDYAYIFKIHKEYPVIPNLFSIRQHSYLRMPSFNISMSVVKKHNRIRTNYSLKFNKHC